MTWMQPAIRERRAMLASRLGVHLARIAKSLETHIHNPDKLDAILLDALPNLSPASLVYVIDRKGRQRSPTFHPPAATSASADRTCLTAPILSPPLPPTCCSRKCMCRAFRKRPALLRFGASRTGRIPWPILPPTSF